MPISNAVMVDKVAATDLIEQLRVAVPEEVRQAKRINEESSRLVERAQDEAERIIARAQEQAAFLIEERELTRAAEQRSEEIIEEAKGRGPGDPAGRGRLRRQRPGQARGRGRQGAPEHPARTLGARRALSGRWSEPSGEAPSPRTMSGPMLSYNVADLLRSAPGTSERFDVAVTELPIADEIELADPVDGRDPPHPLGPQHPRAGSSRDRAGGALLALSAPGPGTGQRRPRGRGPAVDRPRQRRSRRRR